jgi:DMSO/TMAO reductase YedYZ molybdopterin-dependent catalytic subunit
MQSPDTPPKEIPREHLGGRPVGRYGFLGVLGLGAASVVWGGPISNVVSRILNPVADSTGLSTVIPTSGWRIYTVADTMPKFDPATWRLTVGGMVEQPLTLSYSDLKQLPRVEQTSTFHCVTGWVIKDVRWAGVRLSDVLDRAKPHATATALRFVSAEQPYDDTLTRDQAALHDVLLAYEMDGLPLKREHGAPVRLVIPEMYGYKNVKWVSEISLEAKASDGYWEQRGYDRDAWVGHSNAVFGIAP